MGDATLLERLRACGLKMGGAWSPVTATHRNEDGEEETFTSQRFVGWTTDEAKADAARDLGATVTTATSMASGDTGWEIMVTERIGG